MFNKLLDMTDFKVGLKEEGGLEPNGQTATLLSRNELKIGDTIYTMDNNLDTDDYYSYLNNPVFSVAFSPDGTKLVIGGLFSGRAKIYSVSGTNVTYISNIYANNNNDILDNTVYSVAFSPDGNSLVLGGNFLGRAKIYSISGTTVTYVSDIYGSVGTTNVLGGDVNAVAFSPDGTKLVIGGLFTGIAKIYSVSGTTVTFVSNIYADAGTTALSSTLHALAFSSDGTKLVLGGAFTGRAKIYSVSGTNVTFVSNIYSDAGTTALSNTVYALAFSPNGNSLVLGGEFTNRAKIYTVSGTTVTFVSDIYANAGTTTFTSAIRCFLFSSDGTKLVLGGVFSGNAKIYSVSGTTLTYVSDIYADAGTTTLTSGVNAMAFSFNGNNLIIGGQFTRRLKIYSVSGTTVTYLNDIYADSGTTLLDNIMYSASFSSDGTKLVVGGDFEGRSKIYSVSGTNVTFISDIYADNTNTVLSSIVYSVAFSSDGTKLVLGGAFTGRAKIYSVSGTTVTYVSDIYADAGTTALSGAVNAVAFSPNGNNLVLGGQFTGRAKIYSVSGTNVTFVSDIYANVGTTALSNTVNAVAFSPDGTKLVVGGQFTGNAKIYSVSGTTVTFVSDIYANAGTTALSGAVNALAFSPDGTKLVVGGQFTGYCNYYKVTGTTVAFKHSNSPFNTVTSLSFIDNNSLIAVGVFTNRAHILTLTDYAMSLSKIIYADTNNTLLSLTVRCVAFNPNNQLFVLGGDFINFSKLYKIDLNNKNNTFLYDIRSGIKKLFSNNINCVTFSPDKSLLLVSGNFTEKVKYYSVAGTTLTYISPVYSTNSTKTLITNDIYTMTFSPSGNMVLIGGSSGYARTYSVIGDTISGLTVLGGLDSSVFASSFSPSGNSLVLGGAFTGFAKIYSVSGTTVTFVSNIYSDAGTTALNNNVNTVAFSPDGTKLVIGGAFTNYAKWYSVSGTTLTYKFNLSYQLNFLNDSLMSAAFSPNGQTLVIGGFFTTRCLLYSVSEINIEPVTPIYADTGTTILDSHVSTLSFSADGTKLVLGGAFTGRAKIYSVSGTTVTFVSNIYADTGTTALSSNVNTIAFPLNGNELILGGAFTNYAKIYTISGTTVTYVNDLHEDDTFFNAVVNSLAFSPDGTKLVIAGGFTNSIKLYNVNGTNITFVSDIYADAGTTVFDSNVFSVAFSPDGAKLVVGGGFTNYAKLYNVSGSTIAFASNISNVNYFIYSISFSPSGNILVLGGNFTGNAKVYSVNNTTVTYISDIYSDAGTTALNGTVYSISFSPSGNSLVLGGDFTNRAKIYSVNNTTITYVNDIYADAGTTALNNTVETIAFSPDGTKLVIGGQFTNRAKLYSVSGTTVTYIDNLYANVGTSALDGTVRSIVFFPKGDYLLLGGDFSNSIKLYKVNASTIIFESQNFNTTYVKFLAFSPDGYNLITSGVSTFFVRIYKIGTQEEDYRVQAHKFTYSPFIKYKNIGYALGNVSKGQSGSFKLLKN
jgi:WD40 repeat protein